MSDPQIPPCPKCGSGKTERVKRAGFFQRVVLSRFGIYPWECNGCRKIFTARNRGKLKRRRRSTGEVHLPPIN